jgi:hypothetical protein
VTTLYPGRTSASAPYRWKKSHEPKKKTNRGPRLTPGGLRPRHPRRTLPGAEEGGATPGREWQQARAQVIVHQTSSKHTFTSWHGRSSNRSPNLWGIAGKNRAHSSTEREQVSGQEAERIQEPLPDTCRVKRVNMKCLVHPHGRDIVR